MGKFRWGSLALILFLLVNAVGVSANSSYFQRIGEGFENQIEVYNLTSVLTTPFAEIELEIPQLFGVGSEEWQTKFNKKIKEKVASFGAEIALEAQKFGEEYSDQEIPSLPWTAITTSEVKLNKGGLLSLAITYYSYTGGAHGLTWVDYLNLDLTSGRRLQFSDLFNGDEELEKIAEIINDQIATDPSWYFIDHFTADLLQPDHDFYLRDGEVVVCFGLYEITPYAAGIQEFAIPLP